MGKGYSFLPKIASLLTSRLSMSSVPIILAISSTSDFRKRVYWENNNEQLCREKPDLPLVGPKE